MISVKNLKKIINQFDDNWMVTLGQDEYHTFIIYIEDIHYDCVFSLKIYEDFIQVTKPIFDELDEFFGRGEEGKELKLVTKAKPQK